MNKWYKLGDIVISSLKGITPKYVDDGNIIVLNQKCIRNNKIDYSFSRRHDENKRFSEAKVLRIGDLLFNSTGQGTAGRCAFVRHLPKDKKVITDSHILIVRIEDYYLAECFSYLCYKEENLIQTFMDGSTGQGELDKLRLFNLEFRLPISTSRKRVCELLNDINAKIEVNNKINQELEAMAKTIYDYWFVQFDFPDANGKPYKSSSGKMVYNKVLKREIPEGWEVDELGDILETELGGTPSTKVSEFWNGNIPWLNSGEIANFPIIDSEEHITEDAISNSATSLMSKGTCVLSITRHLRPSILGIDACANQSVVGILESDKLKASFIYPYLKNEIPRLMSLRTGAQQPHINKKTVDTSLIVHPPIKILEAYYESINSIYCQIINNSFQNQKLAKLRDWLLPMLMNGQVTVGNAKQELGMVVEEAETYGKDNTLNMVTVRPINKDAAIIGVHIVSQLTESKGMGRTKFQKVLHLCEYFCEKELGGLYTKKAAGPHNDILIRTIEGKFKNMRHISITNDIINGKKHFVYKTTPRTVESEDVYRNLSQQFRQKLDYLIDVLKPLSLKESEAISTLYAVWNNRLIESLEVNTKLLKHDFYSWSKRKKQEFLDPDITKAMETMKLYGIIPCGWGNYISDEQ